MGDAGGDSDWYGYCLDDPVKGVDPLGLKGGFWGGLTEIGDGLGQLWDKAPAGVSEAKAGSVGSIAPSLIRQGKDAAKAVGGKIEAISKNPEFAKTGNAIGDFVSGALPGGPPTPNGPGLFGFALGETVNTEQLINKAQKWIIRK